MKLKLLIWLMLLPLFATAQDDSDYIPEGLPSVRNKVYKGYYFFPTEEDGDSTLMLVLNPIVCFPDEVFKNKKQEEFYWRTVRDVKKALPYAKLISATLIETYEYLETLPTKKEREQHMKRMEDALFKQYKPELKRFSRRQAKVLVKLIYRETNQPSYGIIKAFLGSFRAGVWQAFGKIFGVSLKADWKPDTDSNDALIERICTRIEQGTL